MEKYNYTEAVKADILAYLEDNEIELNEDNFEDGSCMREILDEKEDEE